MTLRQIHFASVDLELHARFTPGQVRRPAQLRRGPAYCGASVPCLAWHLLTAPCAFPPTHPASLPCSPPTLHPSRRASLCLSGTRAVAQRTTVMPPLPEDRFLCSFSHIFAGGYSAG